LVSTAEVYGTASGGLSEDTVPELPISQADLLAFTQCLQDSWQDFSFSWMERHSWRHLSAIDPDRRWVYAISKYIQEELLKQQVEAENLHILRLSNVFGTGQFRVISQMIHKAMAGIPIWATDTFRSFVHIDEVTRAVEAGVGNKIPAGTYNVAQGAIALPALAGLILEELNIVASVEMRPMRGPDVSGLVNGSKLRRFLNLLPLQISISQFVRSTATSVPSRIEPAIPVVIPPRPNRPDIIMRRLHHCLQSGALKFGNRWTRHATDLMSQSLALPEEKVVFLTNSGTSALRMAFVAAAGSVQKGDIAILPSFSFAATAEVLVQLGYTLRFCDVDLATWTLCPIALRRELAKGGVKLVVTVDALGNPSDFDALKPLCADFGVPLVADSAPSLGAHYKGVPVGSQASAHAFSMSFAKTISSGGAGGAVIVDAEAAEVLSSHANWWRSSQMTEMAAIVAIDQMERLDAFIERREEIAEAYSRLALTNVDIVPQVTTAQSRHAWVHWAARFKHVDRSILRRELANFGIDTKPYYSPLLHLQNWGEQAESSFSLPHTEAIALDNLALPMSSELDLQLADQIAFTIARITETCFNETKNLCA
jgi:dTDP-4-amino-4,6-dideoxygalactose transaminase